MTSLSDAIAGFDPAAATDLTSWTDSLLASLNSIDLALPSTADPAAAAAAVTPDISSSTATIPLTVLEDTEPAVNVSVDGGSSLPMLVDTGSSGLVIPWEDLGSTTTQQLENLFSLGFPSSFGESGYSGGVDYIYLTYDNVPTDYGNGALDTTGPVDVEILSWPTSFTSPPNFETFLADNDVSGILGIGENSAGPTTSPLESYGGVLVDVPDGKLIVDSANPGTAFATVSGAPIANLYESINGGTPVAVSDDVDSGGVFGTIPSSLESGSSVPSGTTIDVYNQPGGTLLYSYTTDNLGTSGYDGPTPVTGTSIDSGVLPFLQEPIYISYTDNMMSFDKPLA